MANKEVIDPVVGQRIKEERVRQRLLQQRLVDKTEKGTRGLSSVELSRLENGRVNASIKEINSYATALGVSARYLLGPLPPVFMFIDLDNEWISQRDYHFGSLAEAAFRKGHVTQPGLRSIWKTSDRSELLAVWEADLEMAGKITQRMHAYNGIKHVSTYFAQSEPIEIGKESFEDECRMIGVEVDMDPKIKLIGDIDSLELPKDSGIKVYTLFGGYDLLIQTSSKTSEFINPLLEGFNKRTWDLSRVRPFW